MTFLSRSTRLLYPALALSLLFNASFLGAFGYKEYRARCACCTVPGEAPNSLSADQRLAIEAGRKKLEARLAPLRARMAEECRKLAGIMAQPEPAVADIEAETAALADIQRQVQEMILENYIAERASLPREQRGYYDGLLKERLCSMGGCPMAASGQPCGTMGEMEREAGPTGPKTNQPDHRGETR